MVHSIFPTQSRNAFPFTGDIAGMYEAKAALWAPYYTLMEQQLGATATLVNFGDTDNFGAVGAATGTGMRFHASGLAPTWTFSEALNAWDTPINLASPGGFQGLAPVQPFNGTDEEMDTPDNPYFSRNDAGGEGFSIGAWISIPAGANRIIMAKWDQTTSSELREWRLFINSDEKPSLNLYDESANVQAANTADDAISNDTWLHLVVTYDGGGGATAADGITFYVNGVSVASTASNNGSYVAMEDLTTVVTLGYDEGTGGAKQNFFDGSMLGGPWAPFFVQAELTAAQIKNIHSRMRLGLGL